MLTPATVGCGDRSVMGAGESMAPGLDWFVCETNLGRRLGGIAPWRFAVCALLFGFRAEGFEHRGDGLVV
jgi:hypothetical protein